MKRVILSGLTVLLLSAAAAPAVNAQVTPVAPPSNADAIGMAVTPFNLVFLAYQGFFESEGIPKFGSLVDAYESREITAEDLVRVAVSMRRLPTSALTDQGYINAVDLQLRTMGTQGDS